jgi:Holliday junction DNA helicase RuvA
MFSYLQGTVVSKEPPYVVLDVNGVGYELLAPLSTYSPLQTGQQYKLYAYLHVKEDAHTLFGFLEKQEKWLFLKLISVSGVGPSTALGMLSALSVKELHAAIVGGNIKVIQAIKGIGPKTAQRLVLELQDRLSKESPLPSSSPAGQQISAAENSADVLAPLRAQADALDALVAMGIAKPSAEKLLTQVVKLYGSGLTTEQLIKLSFKVN